MLEMWPLLFICIVVHFVSLQACFVCSWLCYQSNGHTILALFSISYMFVVELVLFDRSSSTSRSKLGDDILEFCKPPIEAFTKGFFLLYFKYKVHANVVWFHLHF